MRALRQATRYDPLFEVGGPVHQSRPWMVIIQHRAQMKMRGEPTSRKTGIIGERRPPKKAAASRMKTAAQLIEVDKSISPCSEKIKPVWLNEALRLWKEYRRTGRQIHRVACERHLDSILEHWEGR